MEFVKMQGLGNDFVVIEGPVNPAPADLSAWCDRRHGVGADGVLAVTPLDSELVRMQYWNADGGVAEMCGNGLRCVARYAVAKEWVDSPTFVVETAVGPLPVEVLPEGRVRALLGQPRSDGDVEVAGVPVHTVDIGNPHAIQWVDDPGQAPVRSLGPAIETAAPFPQGTNAEFGAVVGENRIELRVWERGVGETLACGTGAAATAFIAREQGLVGDRVEVQLLGGTLVVSIDDAGAWIEGPAEFVFAGSLY